MTPWRRFRLWIFMRDMKREHRALVKSFDRDPRAGATLAVCTCVPGATDEWPTMDHAPGCRTWLV